MKKHAVLAALVLALICTVAHAEGDPQGPSRDRSFGFLAACIVCGVSVIAAGVAVAVVGSAALGAVAEKPELAGRALLFVGLAEGLGIYGLLLGILILLRL